MALSWLLNLGFSAGGVSAAPAVDDTGIPTYIVRAGWRNGTWTEVGSNYTWAQLASSFWWHELAAGPVPNEDLLEIHYDRRVGDQTDRPSIGRASLLVDDPGGVYKDPSIGALNLTTDVVVSVKAQTNGTSSIYSLFSGKAERITLNPALDNRRVEVSALDYAEALRRQTRTGLQPDIGYVSLANLIMRDVNLPAQLSSLSSSIKDKASFAFMDGVAAGEALGSILEAGGHFAFVNGRGQVVLEYRNYDVVASPIASLTSVLGLSYELSDELLINNVQITAEPRQIAVNVTSVAEATGEIVIPASGSISFFAQYQDPDTLETPLPVQSLVTPVASQDVRLNEAPDESGIDQTSAVGITVTPFATSALVEMSNNIGTALYLTHFFLRGYPALRLPPFVTFGVNSASIMRYGAHDRQIDSELITNFLFSVSYAQYLVSRFAQPIPQTTLTVRNAWPLLVQAELLDMVHLVNSHLGIASDHVIREARHAIVFGDTGAQHTAVWLMRTRATKDFLVLDHPTLGKLDNRKLGF